MIDYWTFPISYFHSPVENTIVTRSMFREEIRGLKGEREISKVKVLGSGKRGLPGKGFDLVNFQYFLP